MAGTSHATFIGLTFQDVPPLNLWIDRGTVETSWERFADIVGRRTSDGQYRLSSQLRCPF